ncbi:DinB family protein [Nocardia sp. NPDC057440]|uniref:DinB family protein n=1 Tax=Nocardia sp. NPDC057440 TaxID=3346134 RepID=UPI00366C740D
MTWTAPDIDRSKTPLIADERPMLRTWLDFHRQTLLLKCAGLNSEQLKQRCVAPSSLSLLGLVRHMSEVERGWFRTGAGGEALDYLYCGTDNPDGDFDDILEADAAADFAAYRREVELADAAVADLPLDHTFIHPRRPIEYSLRWVYVHMIEEYARHNGHADFLRERIDGVTGD